MSPKQSYYSRTFALLFVLSVSASVSYGVDFPAPITKCHMNDEQCLLEQASKFVEAYPHGIPELGIDSLEPYKMGDVEILGDKKSAASFDLFLTEVQMEGFSNMKMTKLRGFSKDTSKPMVLQQASYQPKIILKAKYRIDGKILILPIKGEGDFEWTLTGIESKAKITLKPVQRAGKTFIDVEDYKLLTKMKNVKTNMTNLFNGDPELSENMLKVINDNWELLSKDISPKVNEAIAKEQIKRLEKFFENIPYEDYFLPDEK